jgi:methyl-accepting chemotaxis protein
VLKPTTNDAGFLPGPRLPASSASTLPRTAIPSAPAQQHRTIDHAWNIRPRPDVLLGMTLDVDALETSFDLIAPRGEELVETFYRRLFAAAPSVRPLFASTEMRRQKTKLLATLVLLRKSLPNLDAVVPKLRELGGRHGAYGARAEHYPLVGATLIASMAELAGDAWRPEYERAWSDAFDVVASAMLEGAAAAA